MNSGKSMTGDEGNMHSISGSPKKFKYIYMY